MTDSVHAPIPWEDIDTVMVDMDGTLLDLAFDNFFWRELVPLHYARHRNLPEEVAQRELAGRYRALEGQLAWYCIDHWSDVLELDIKALKWAHRDRIRYLPQATKFLEFVRRSRKRLLLVTNAHRETLAVKVAQTGLDQKVDSMVSSHDYRVPKQAQAFWERLLADEKFDPERTLLVEDSLGVLEAAQAFGLKFTIAIRRPDSGQPPREISSFPSVDSIHELSK
jgi:putative hydrolase of the HAD superfamily